MTLEQLEQRVNDLEKQVSELRERLQLHQIPSSIAGTFGIFGDDPEFDEIVRLGREYRRQVNSEDTDAGP